MAKAGTLPVFLKCIAIQGFKSFADKVKFELGQGLSVVVGPNGSGKSNVADAVRWVLGEQSAKNLRGSKMEDVIFAGSTVRRPVGMAEVSLIFDNSTGIFPLDYQEITVTRRVYRDGEGQYFINRVTCRLKDIHELFMDTGAGKEGFSIIGQGRVEEILNLKSEERRILIEEASGITKFRMRKREALKRLEETEHNLERLEDILAEIEDRLAPLQEQARVAEEAAALMTEQRTLEVQLLVRDLKELRSKLASSTEETEQIKRAVSGSMVELAQGEALIQEEKVELNELESRIQSAQESAYQLDQAIQQILHEQDLRRERAKHLQDQTRRLQLELDSAQLKEQHSLDRKTALETRRTLLHKTTGELLYALQTLQSQYDDAKKRTDVETIERSKGKYQRLQAEHAQAAGELNRLNQAVLGCEQVLSQIQMENTEKTAEAAALVNTLNTQHHELKLRQEQDENTQTLIQGSQAEVASLKQEQEKKSADLTALNRDLERMKAKYHALKNLEDALDGYQKGVRELMLAKKKNAEVGRGLWGTVAELITVDERFEVAIETALGGNLQNIVAETEKDAKAAVNYLKAHQLGRATFLPLDVVQGSRLTLAKGVAEDPDFVGIAGDLVHYLPQFKPAIESQLGRILVVTHMEAATRVARASGYRARIVTLEGDQVHPGGSLTGGSLQRKGGNLLGRSRELQEMQKVLTQKNAEQEEQGRDVQRMSEHRQALGARMQEQLAFRQSLKEEIAVLHAQAQNTQDRIARNQQERDGLFEREKHLQQELAEQRNRVSSLSEVQSKLAQDLAEAQREWQEHELKVRDATREAEGIQEKLTQTMIQEAKYEQELEQAEDALLRENQDLRDITAERQSKTSEIALLFEKEGEIKQEQDELRVRHAVMSETQIKAQGALSELRKERELRSEGLLKKERSVHLKRQELQSLEQKVHGFELRRTRWETEWENDTKRLTEEFALAWEEAEAYVTDRERSTLWSRIQEIKRASEELGAVNYAALTEYPKAKERFEFLSSQKQDLVEAKETLAQLIGELDKTMSQSFEEGFKAVNEAFQTVFKELFNGGFAELKLNDPDNLLETGVEIIAQPPGKKAQLLSLLSGGERALTAIGLLFALLRVKPSPFCILDEIEASLDDANVSRFAKYINRLSHSTQFLVISHRKGTMEAANTLYGIAMEESGVSKLLSVKLEGAGDEPQTA